MTVVLSLIFLVLLACDREPDTTELTNLRMAMVIVAVCLVCCVFCEVFF